MKIVNETDLSYATIGKIIDIIKDEGVGDTHYFGQVEYTTCELENGKEVRIIIRYLKKYVEWRFDYEK
jgi:hypothetical protein